MGSEAARRGLVPWTARRFRVHSLFFRILVVMVSLLVVSILGIGLGSYRLASRRLLEASRANHEALLSQTMDVMERRVTNLESMSVQISVDRRVRAAMAAEGGSNAADIIAMHELGQYLAGLRLVNLDLDGLYLYLSRQGLVITESTMYRADEYFPLTYGEVGWSVRSRLDRRVPFQSLGLHPVLTRGTDAVVFARSLPLGAQDPAAAVVMHMERPILDSMLDPVISRSSSTALVLDRDGVTLGFRSPDTAHADLLVATARALVLASPEVAPIERLAADGVPGFTVLHRRSPASDWHYFGFIPNRVISAEVLIIRNLTLGLGGAVLLVCAILAWLLAYRIYEPVQRLMELAVDGGDSRQPALPTGDELEFVGTVMLSGRHETRLLRSMIDRQQASVRAGLLRRLLDGDTVEPDELERGGVIHSFDEFAVILVAVDAPLGVPWSQAECDRQAARMQQEAVRVAGDRLAVELTAPDSASIACICNLPADLPDPDLLHSLAEELVATSRSMPGALFTAGIGRTYRGTAGIARSCTEARSTVRYRIVRGLCTVIFHDEIEDASDALVDYPIDVEMRLINLAKTGQLEPALELLDDAVAAATNRPNLAPQAAHDLFAALAATIERLLRELQPTPDSSARATLVRTRVEAAGTIPAKHSVIREELSALVRAQADHKHSQRRRVFGQVVAHVTENYFRDLSLTDISTATGYSPSYISLVFREASGTNFLDYLHSLRIDEAKGLLEAGTMTASEIAAEVGYTSLKSFIRVFKKTVGVPPGEYRNAAARRTGN